MLSSSTGNSLEEAEVFRQKVAKEIDREQQMLESLKAPHRGVTLRWIIVFVILGSAVVFLFLNPVGYLLWLIIAFILRSFYWISWFLPTSREKADKSEKTKIKRSGDNVKSSIVYMLKKKKKLGVEMGVTMLVTGMAPLALSNFILFGVGIVLGAYFGLIIHLWDYNSIISVLFQMAIILVTFVMMLFLKPHERGFKRTAGKLKGGYTTAQRRGRFIAYSIIALIGLFIALLGLIFVVSMFAPGGTWQAIWSKLQENGFNNLFLLALIFLTELILLRFFQGISSTRMLRQYLPERIQNITNSSLAPIDKAINQAKSSNSSTVDKNLLKNAMKNFYSIAVFDIYEHNIFGRFRVFVIGPKVSILLDEEALTHID